MSNGTDRIGHQAISGRLPVMAALFGCVSNIVHHDLPSKTLQHLELGILYRDHFNRSVQFHIELSLYLLNVTIWQVTYGQRRHPQETEQIGKWKNSFLFSDVIYIM